MWPLGISFCRIAEVIADTMQHIPFTTESSLETYLETDREARLYAASLI